jgi:hypothetical protein
MGAIFGIALSGQHDAAGVSRGAPPQDKPALSGLVAESWRDGWTYCKATAKLIDRHTWIPWLGAVAALLSAVAGTAVFATLQNDATQWARITVATIAVLTALVTALQSWVTRRDSDLRAQMKQFHRFHREAAEKIEALLQRREALPAGYPRELEEKLADITAGMMNVGNRQWDKAKREVEADMRDFFGVECGERPSKAD